MVSITEYFLSDFSPLSFMFKAFLSGIKIVDLSFNIHYYHKVKESTHTRTHTRRTETWVLCNQQNTVVQ